MLSQNLNFTSILFKFFTQSSSKIKCRKFWCTVSNDIYFSSRIHNTYMRQILYRGRFKLESCPSPLI